MFLMKKNRQKWLKMLTLTKSPLLTKMKKKKNQRLEAEAEKREALGLLQKREEDLQILML